MQLAFRWLGVAGTLAALWGCASTPQARPPDQTRTPLRVRLYSYIPDAGGDELLALNTRIEAEFEKAHPGIDLILNPACFDFYDPQGTAGSLRGDCTYDVFETDTVILGELVDSGAIRPWPRLPENVSWHPAGLSASTHSRDTKQDIYGVPHWLCDHFIMSREEAVQQARSTSELVRALAALGTSTPGTAANMLGSWNLPALYLDAWADQHGAGNIRSAVTTESPDAAVLESMRSFVRTCASNGKNPCLDGTFDGDGNEDVPAKLFATGKARTTLGYSERLHTIIKNLPAGADRSEIRVSSAPLGEGNHPLLFTDAFFLSARCTGDCEQAALRFTTFMSQPSTYEWILMSEDAPEATRVPRYLLPASLDAYDAPKVRADPLYSVLAQETRTGAPFPSSGLLKLRKKMRDSILSTLSAP